jgi:hypothetical protein
MRGDSARRTGNLFLVSNLVVAVAVLLSAAAGCGGNGRANEEELARSVLRSARLEARSVGDQVEAGGGEAVDFHGPATCTDAGGAALEPSGRRALYECSYRITSTSAGPATVSATVTIYSIDGPCWKGVLTGYSEKLSSGRYKKKNVPLRQIDSGAFDRRGCA